MKPLSITLIAAALTLPAVAQAEQVYLGYSSWNYKVSGYYQDSAATYDLGADLNRSAQSRNQYHLRWDTPGNWAPDLTANYGHLDANGQVTIVSNGLGPLPIGQTSTTANIDARLRDMDLTLRYGIPLDWARLSLGVTVKQVKGDVNIASASTPSAQTQQKVNAVFPLAHLALEVPIGSRLRVGVSGGWIAANGDQAENFTALARLKLIGPLDLTGGWQHKRYKVNSDNYRLDAKLQGWLIGGELAF